MTPRRRRATIVAAVALALVGSVSVLALLPADAADKTGSSAVTKVGVGDFTGLEVTVSKTKELINEVVTVTWKGGKQSLPVGFPRRNFLQIMQCWGDTAPDPTQCQYGGLSVTAPSLPYGNIYSRQLTNNPALFPKDPVQTVDPTWGEADRAFLPFTTAGGETVPGTRQGTSNFFDLQGTNEIPVAPTRADGTGTEFFEVQTATEAPGLGCGKTITVAGKAQARGCWLVVVPRGATEVDGTVREEGSDERLSRLQTSPLSATNWAKKITFPLGFQGIGGTCPLGVGQITLLGNEFATEAVSRWQPALCKQANAVFDFNQIPDTAGRTNLNGSQPNMALLGAPLAMAPPAGKPVYAPIAVTGLGFAYNIETRVENSDPEDVRKLGGQRITDLNLSARLVAKLLTQSYRGGTDNPQAPAANPFRIEDDKEFLVLNPIFEKINRSGPSAHSIITPLNPTDANALVWQWIASDPKARAFIAGTPDENGMVVNEAWKNFALTAVTDFPKIDQVCRPATADKGELCLANSHPYAGDMHEAVRSAIRGDTLVRLEWDPLAIPPQYKKSPPQQKGQREIIVVSDSATAARFNLPMVRLQNASGKFVAPTTKSLAAGLAAMKKSAIPGVLTPNPSAPGNDVYPLTTVSYATTVPAGLSAKDRTTYAAFIRYAVGTGQVRGETPGTLPAGYLPLTRAMKDSSMAAATTLTTYKPAGTAKPTAPARGNSGGKTRVVTTSGSGGGGAPPPSTGSETPPKSVPSPEAIPAQTPTTAPALEPPTTTTPQTVNTAAGATPDTPAGSAAKALLYLLLIAGLAVAGARALPRVRPAVPRQPAVLAGRPACHPTAPPPPVADPGAHRGGDAGARSPVSSPALKRRKDNR